MDIPEHFKSQINPDHIITQERWERLSDTSKGKFKVGDMPVGYAVTTITMDGDVPISGIVRFEFEPLECAIEKTNKMKFVNCVGGIPRFEVIV